jgi:MHS family shikimate/dehydroshikimate transporter-like MFS transporter
MPVQTINRTAPYTPAAAEKGSGARIRSVALASAIGTTIEWYDFFLYATASALVFNKLYFPTFDPRTGTLAAFAANAVGFLARPVGGIIAGHFGDRLGRKSMLVLTLVVMGLATSCIGILPTYAQIGAWAPALLVALRFVQGLGVGGEWGGAVLMAIEHAPPGRRGFYGSWPQVGVPLGLILANGVFAVFSRLPEAAFLSWGWRIPFLLSFALVAVGLIVRLRLVESPVFARVKEAQREAAVPVLEVLRENPRGVLLSIGVQIGEKAAFYVYTTFLLFYGTAKVGLPRDTILKGVLIGAACLFFAIPAAGAISDRVGRRPVYLFGACVMGLFAYPLYALFDTGSPVLVWLALAIALVFSHAPLYAPAAAFQSEFFEPRVRYTGASLGAQVSGAIGGGFSPIIATALLPLGRGALAAQLVAMALITIIAVLLSPETARHSFEN